MPSIASNTLVRMRERAHRRRDQDWDMHAPVIRGCISVTDGARTAPAGRQLSGLLRHMPGGGLDLCVISLSSWIRVRGCLAVLFSRVLSSQKCGSCRLFSKP